MLHEELKKPLADRLAEKRLQAGNEIFIRIFKWEALLELWLRPAGRESDPFTLLCVYPVRAMSGHLGPKLRQGDKQAPEGFYSVDLGQLNPKSKFHLAFNIGYPNAYDLSQGCTGDFIMVHGGCVSEGCFAMTDPCIDEIYGLAEQALGNGQPFFRVHIFPFRMNKKNLAAHASSRWQTFWQMLKPGYDYFERTGRPPDIRVRDGRYELSADNPPSSR